MTREASKLETERATSSAARSKAAWFAADGFWNPVIFLTNCKAAARISSGEAFGSKLYSVLIFLHIRPILLFLSYCQYTTALPHLTETAIVDSTAVIKSGQ